MEGHTHRGVKHTPMYGADILLNFVVVWKKFLKFWKKVWKRFVILMLPKSESHVLLVLMFIICVNR